MAGFFDFLNFVPSDAASNVRAAAEPVLRPKDTFNADDIAAGLHLSPNDTKEVKDNISTQAAIANMRQQMIDKYQAPSRSGLDILGQVFRGAGSAISAKQGNYGASDMLLKGLQDDADKAHAFDQDRVKMSLDNADKTLTGIGTDTLGYLAKRRELKLATQQKVQQQLQLAALNAEPGEDAHAIQARVVQSLLPSLRAQGMGDYADALEKSYPNTPAPAVAAPSIPPTAAPTLSAPPVATPPGPIAGPTPGPSLPLQAPPPGQQVGPTNAAAAAAMPTQALPPPAAAPAPTTPVTPHEAKAVDAYHKYMKMADNARLVGDEDSAKAYEGRASDILKATKIEKITDAAGNDTLVRTDASDTNGQPRILRPQSENGDTVGNPDLNTIVSDPALSGQDFYQALKKIDPVTAERVKMIGEFRAPPVSGNRGKSGNIMALVEKYRPGYFAGNYQNAEAVRKSFSSGDDAKTTAAFNMAIEHGHQLLDINKQVGNTGYSYFNPIYNMFRNTQNNPELQKAQGNFKVHAHGLAVEAEKAFKGSGDPAEGAVQQLQSALGDPNATQASVEGAVKGLMDMLAARIRGHREKFNRGTMAADEDIPLFTPDSKKALDQMLGDGATDAMNAKLHAQGTPPAHTIDPASVPHITSQADYDKLAPGASYLAADGVTIKKKAASK